MSVDLHSHSTASDGSLAPSDLVARAVERGLTAIAITDHDTLEGVAEARGCPGANSIEVIPGIELSLEYAQGTMHLVVLWLEPGPGALQDRLAELRAGRDTRNEVIVSILNEAGMEITLEELAAEAGGGSVGRPHIAAILFREGYVASVKEAFDLWLAKGRPAYVGRPRLSPGEAISLARESGGLTILAHPHTLNIDRAAEMADLLTELRRHGLVGLEAIYSSYQRHEREGYADLARRHGLIPSGGSDFHGKYKPGLDLGVGYGDLDVPDQVLDQLRSCRGDR